MRFEKSAGVIVFRRGKKGAEYLLLQNSSKFFWDLPKGNIGAEESEQETALRELAEEAGLKRTKLIPGFREIVEYFYTFEREKIHKVVVMFLAESAGEDVKLSWEHSDYKWVPFETAETMLKEKKIELIQRAHKFLSSRLEKWTK